MTSVNSAIGSGFRNEDAPPITPDAIIHYDEDSDRYEIDMTNDPAPNLYISGRWKKFLKEKQGDHSRQDSNRPGRATLPHHRIRAGNP